jgi:hypothetical protein
MLRAVKGRRHHSSLRIEGLHDDSAYFHCGVICTQNFIDVQDSDDESSRERKQRWH